METIKPNLTEPGVRYFLRETLKKCHSKRSLFNNKLFNIALFVIFLGVLGSLLYYKYKGKLTPTEKKARILQKEHYIAEKIRSMSEKAGAQSNMIITDLPQPNKIFK